jgi:Flp pilus assembly protein TadB
MSFSMSLFAYTVIFQYRMIGLASYSILLVLIILSIACLDLSNSIVAKEERNARSRAKEEKEKTVEQQSPAVNADGSQGTQPSKVNTHGASKVTLSSKNELLLARLRIGSYIFLFLIVAFTSYIAVPAVQDPSDLVIAYILAFLCARMPDLDKDITDGDMRFHRNPVSHSAIYGLVTGYVAILLIATDVMSTAKIIFFIAIVIGVASHLIVDNIESEMPISDAVRAIVHRAKCPGDIRHIRSKRQHEWLWLNAITLIIMAVLLYGRYEMYASILGMQSYNNYTYAFIFTTNAWILTGIVGACYIAILIAAAVWHGTEKEAKHEEHVKEKEKAEKEREKEHEERQEDRVEKPAKPAKRAAAKRAPKLAADGTVKPAKPRAKRPPKPAPSEPEPE